MPYTAPVPEFTFLFDHVVGLAEVAGTDRFEEASPDMVSAILTEAGRISEEVLAPLNRVGDETGAVLENGTVRTSPGFAEGYTAIAEGGYVGISADPEYGGLGLPLAVTTAVNEMIGSACLSLQLNPLMSQGQIEALEHHGSDALKALYLPKLISGEWCGTMNLTEPQAGSDVGALRAKAEDNGDGTYAITGQKIYISWGDNDFSENVCHLVLARLPDGAPGTKGISLFMVPKFIPNADGTPSARNSLNVVSLEHKMGLHGSPTAVMQYDGATGWMVGKPHGGMAAMFTMMNNARLGVGVQGISAAEGAYQHALAYAAERKQGRSPVEGGTGAIIDHADVRRMLMQMKAEIFAARAIALDTAVSTDMATATGEAKYAARAALLTPITKAYGTETGINVSQLGIQVHGGMGFIEETGAAQYLRDVRVTAIYEGTNGIQAMDLVGRKMLDGGAAMFALLDQMDAVAAAAGDMGSALKSGADALRDATKKLVTLELNDRFAGAVPYLLGAARVLGAFYHVKAAMAEGQDGPRTKLARYFLAHLFPQADALLSAAVLGADDFYALTPEELAS